MSFLFLFLIFFIFSVITTGFIRNFSIKNNLFDIPNNRSSHTTPKPKGGGIVIVIPLIVTLIILFFQGMIEIQITKGIVLGLILVAIIGLIDDYKNLAASIRVIVYLISAGLSLHFIGGLESVTVNEISYYLGNIGYYSGLLFLLWLTNLYNFMDGTDGFAAAQTICVSVFCFFLFYSSDDVPFSIIMLCLASTSIGFLYWNWAPAKIFMGDVGSCTIGLFFGLLAIHTENKGTISIFVWAILLAPFIADATLTLIKRIFNNENWHEAHNSHAYQKLYQHGLTHDQLALKLILINILLIWPLAYIAHTYQNYSLFVLVLSYLIMATIWFLIQSQYKRST